VELSWQAIPNALLNRSTPPAAGSGEEPQAYSKQAAQLVDAELGAPYPFFWTQQVESRFELTQVFPSEIALDNSGVPVQAISEIETSRPSTSIRASASCSRAFRTLALRKRRVSRIGSTTCVRCCLSRQDSSYVLVFDTHNPGGSGQLAQPFVCKHLRDQAARWHRAADACG
jgi:hypothetical protein